MMCFEFSIDLEKELTRLLGYYRIFVPSSIINELEFLSINSSGMKKIKAKAGLKLIDKYDRINVNIKNADESLVSLAKKNDGIVVTNDKELRKKLKSLSIPVIFLRAKKKLMIE